MCKTVLSKGFTYMKKEQNNQSIKHLPFSHHVLLIEVNTLHWEENAIPHYGASQDNWNPFWRVQNFLAICDHFNLVFILGRHLYTTKKNNASSVYNTHWHYTISTSVENHVVVINSNIQS